MAIKLWTSNDESVWRAKIGMSRKDDHRPPKERAVFLRRLRSLVEQRLLHFIHDEDRDPLSHEDRECTWTPIAWVCHNLEISPPHLSRLLRELSGVNAVQFYDQLKLAETFVPWQYLNMLQAFINDRLANLSSTNGSAEFWNWLKEQRNDPNFNRQSLAREFDFPNAIRFHQAFCLNLNQTPREFENRIVHLALTNSKEVENLINQHVPKPASSESRGLVKLHDVIKNSPTESAEIEIKEAAPQSNQHSTLNNNQSTMPSPFTLAQRIIATALLRLVTRARAKKRRAPPYSPRPPP